MNQNVSAFGIVLAHLGGIRLSGLRNPPRIAGTLPRRLRRFPVMAYRCEVCGKEPWVGKQVSFSHKRSSRRWLPNIQRVRVKHGSNSKRVRVCTSCIKAGKVQKA